MIDQRNLGKNGPAVGCLGYGAMVLEGYYGASDDSQAIDTIHRALDLGMTRIDTADAFGNGRNETLIGRAIKGRRDRAFIATKFGIVFDEQEPERVEENTKAATQRLSNDTMRRMALERE